MKVLIVDDHAGIREFLSGYLKCEDRFESVLVADSVAAAKEIILAEAPELVFTDLNMPKESGLDLICWVKSEVPSTVIVLMSTDEIPESKADFQIDKNKFVSSFVEIAKHMARSQERKS